MNTRLKLAAALSLVASLTAVADVKVNEHFSINGYAVGAATNTNIEGAPDIQTYFESKGSPAVVNADAVKLGLLGSAQQVSGYVSFLYLPGAADEAGLLDAYATFDTGAGVKITGGKFLSYLGYEAFDPINMTQLTYGSTIFAIPGYHTGAKIDVTTKSLTFGAAVVDSLFHGANGFLEGDREYDDDIGWEAYASFTGIENLTIFAGFGGENNDGPGSDPLVFDLWASYAVSDTITIAGEFDTMRDTGRGWLAFLNFKASDQFSTAFRVSGVRWDDAIGGGNDRKYTVAPTFTLSENVQIRGEFSLGEGDSGDYKFWGVQGVLKF